MKASCTLARTSYQPWDCAIIRPTSVSAVWRSSCLFSPRNTISKVIPDQSACMRSSTGIDQSRRTCPLSARMKGTIAGMRRPALARGDLRRAWPMVAGTVFLICFVAIRAASFHHIDRFIGIRLAGMRMNWILELGGIGLVAYGAVRAGAVGWIRYPHVAGTGSGGSS